MKKAELAVKILRNELQDKRVLEAACGRADFSVCASELAAEIECVDIDEKRLVPEFASVKNAKFCKMDVTAMTYGDEYFDTVVMYDAIGHLDYVLECALTESLRVLKKHGCLAVISSSKMDKNVISERLIPLLNGKGLEYTFTEEKSFSIVRIVK